MFLSFLTQNILGFKDLDMDYVLLIWLGGDLMKRWWQWKSYSSFKMGQDDQKYYCKVPQAHRGWRWSVYSYIFEL